MRRLAAALLPAAPLLLLVIIFAGAPARAATTTTVFRDRAAFEAAAQNLRVIDFEGAPEPRSSLEYESDGFRFESVLGLSVGADLGTTNRKLYGHSIGEFTRLVIYLPPGTTAFGLDQFSRPMDVGGVLMTQGDGSNFVGFVSDAPVASIVIHLTEPEPTPNAVIDNLVFGQRRAGNEPPRPLLLTYAGTGRAAAFDSVALTPEPFSVVAANRATSARTARRA